MGVKMDWLLGKLRESDTTTSGGSPITGTLTPNELVYGTGADTIASLPVATYPSLTEIAYVKGVTSAIQTQLTAKAPTANPTFTGTVTIPSPFTLGATSVTTNGTRLNYLTNAGGTTGTTSTNLVFSTSPTLVTPVLGVATATSINGLTITTTTGTITMTNSKTLAVTNTLTLTGTDGTVMTFPTTSATIARTDAANTFTGTQTFNGTVALGAQSITMTGSIAATGARVTKGWFTDLESTNMPTVGGVAILSSLTAPTFNTIEIGTGQTDTTISRASAGRIAVEGVNVVTISSTDTLTNKTLTKPVINGTDPTAATYTPASGAQNVTIDCAANNMHFVTGNTSGTAITFLISNVTNNQPFIVSITQGTTPSTIAAWFNTIRWAGGAAPTLTAVANKRDVFGFIRTGTNTYDGFIVGQNL